MYITEVTEKATQDLEKFLDRNSIEYEIWDGLDREETYTVFIPNMTGLSIEYNTNLKHLGIDKYIGSTKDSNYQVIDIIFIDFSNFYQVTL